MMTYPVVRPAAPYASCGEAQWAGSGGGGLRVAECAGRHGVDPAGQPRRSVWLA